MNARELIEDLVGKYGCNVDERWMAREIIVAIEASGEYVRVEALLGEKAVEEASRIIPCPTLHPYPCVNCIENAKELIKAAIKAASPLLTNHSSTCLCLNSPKTPAFAPS